MVDDEFDSEPEDNIGNKSYNQGSFEDRFPRPNAARGMPLSNRLPPPFMMRPGMRPSIRPPFNQRFDNASYNRPEMFPPGLISYGPDKKIRRDDFGARNIQQREFANRPEMNNRFELRQPIQNFGDRNVRERPPFLNRFQTPRDNMHFQMPQRMSGNINRFSPNRFAPNILPKFNEPNEIEENKFCGSDEDEDLFNDAGSSKNKLETSIETEKGAVATIKDPENDLTANTENAIKVKSLESPSVTDNLSDSSKVENSEKTGGVSNEKLLTGEEAEIQATKSLNSDNKNNLLDTNATERQNSITPNPSPTLVKPPLFDRMNPSSTFGRSNALQGFQRPNVPSSFDKPNVPPAFDRPNIPPRFNIQGQFDRSNPPFEKVNVQNTFEKSNTSFDKPIAPNAPPAFERQNMYDRNNSSVYDRQNVPQSFDRSNPQNFSSQSFDRANAAQGFDRPNVAQTFDRPNVPPNFDRGNSQPSFERSNVPLNFDRSNAFDRTNNAQNYDRSNNQHSFDRANVPQPFDRTQSFDRQGAPPAFDRPNIPPDNNTFERPNHPLMFNRPNGPQMERPQSFDRSNMQRMDHPAAPRMERLPIFDRPSLPRMEHSQMFERPRMDHQPMFERPRMEHTQIFERPNAPRMEHSQMFERPNAPRMEHPPMFDQTGAPRMDHSQMFERPKGPPFDHTSMFERPATALPVDHQSAIHNLPRPPQYPVGRLPPPHFPGMPPMPAQPPLPHPLSTATATAPSNPIIPSTPGMPPLPFQGLPNMPPMHNRPAMPPFFDPRFAFMAHPHDRPMMPGFPMPGQFRPPFGHIPPPHLLHAPPLPIQSDSSVAPTKTENTLTIATLNEEEVWVQNPTADGRFYYYNLKTRQTNWEKPSDVRVITQTELNTILANKPQPVISSGPMQVTTPAVAVPPQKPAEVAEWNEYKAPDGRAYYHNRRSAVTTWDKPQVLIDWENDCKGIKPGTNESLSAIDSSSQKSKETEDKAAVATVTVKDDSSDESNDDDDEEDESAAGEAGGDSGKGRDKSKPVSSTPVSGTPWCIVWTGDGRVFFFNPAKRSSVWERPDELKGRTDVDKILDEPPKEQSTDKAIEESKANNEPPTKKQKMEEDKELGDDTSNEDGTVLPTATVAATGTTGDELDEDNKMETGTRIESTENTPIKEIVPLSKEAAKEAEERAAKERALLPLEVRMAQFREMLVEKQVSAFSTWEKELHKIVFDPRYLLLASRERKLAFENYVKDRAEEERRENKMQVRTKKDQFKKLLKEANLTPKSSFADFMNKYSKDDRFKCIEKPRDRETLFQDFLADIRKKDKGDMYKDKIKQSYVSLLKEHKFNKNTHWSEAKKRMDNDSRYKAVESSMKREEWFKEYLKNKNGDSRENSEAKRDREKRERQEASIREREKEVKESLSSALRDRDKERDYHLKSEAEQIFRVLLSDMIRNSDDSWKEAKRILRKDSRWEDVSNKLDRPIRDVIFKDHISALKKRSKRK